MGALTAVETRLEERLLARGAAHVGDLRDALEVHRLYADAGMALSAVPHLALVVRCSETKAAELLGDAQMLVFLPGAFNAISRDVLRVDDVHAVCALPSPRAGAPVTRLSAGGEVAHTAGAGPVQSSTALLILDVAAEGNPFYRLGDPSCARVGG